MKATINLDTYDYGYTKATINFEFGGKKWSIKNWPTFSSPKSAENQARKLIRKLGLEEAE